MKEFNKWERRKASRKQNAIGGQRPRPRMQKQRQRESAGVAQQGTRRSRNNALPDETLAWEFLERNKSWHYATGYDVTGPGVVGRGLAIAQVRL